MKNLKLRLLALLLAAVIIAPLLFACGGNEGGGTSDAPATTGEATEATTPEPTTPAPTEAPTTPEPTEPPTTTEPFAPDFTMDYWDQIIAEMAHHGLTGGVKILTGENEEEVMRRFTPTNARRTELDVSGDNVPFSVAWNYEVTKDVENFWEANFQANLARDVPTEVDDLIIGVMWIKGSREVESDRYMADDDPIFYLAVKTPTDEWATEGDVNPRGEQTVQGEWQKVFFYGRVMNEETNSSTMILQGFIGYGLQNIQVGGIMAFKFPGNRDNERGAMGLVGF